MAEGAEGVGAVLGVEVTASGDGVLGAVGRCAVTRRQGVVLEVIVSGIEPKINLNQTKTNDAWLHRVARDRVTSASSTLAMRSCKVPVCAALR